MGGLKTASLLTLNSVVESAFGVGGCSGRHVANGLPLAYISTHTSSRRVSDPSSLLSAKLPVRLSLFKRQHARGHSRPGWPVWQPGRHNGMRIVSSGARACVVGGVKHVQKAMLRGLKVYTTNGQTGFTKLKGIIKYFC